MNITQKQKGILFMILSALSFASMQVVVRMSREIPTMEQICVRNLFILIVSFFIIRKKTWFLLRPEKIPAVPVRPLFLRISGPDHAVLRLQPCCTGRCHRIK